MGEHFRRSLQSSTINIDSLNTHSQPELRMPWTPALLALFYQFVFRANVDKMVGMTCHPCFMAVQHSEAVYKRRMMRERPYYRYRHRERVILLEYAADLEAGSLATHCQTHHGIGRGNQWEDTPPTVDLQMYRVSFKQMTGSVSFPAEGCRGGGDESHQPLDTLWKPPHAG